jgi:hypothetical protein
MRLQNPMLQGKQRDELEEFSNWLLAVGDGTVPAERKRMNKKRRG